MILQCEAGNSIIKPARSNSCQGKAGASQRKGKIIIKKHTQHPPDIIMTELSFAKSFLSTLDSRAIKLQPDYVTDPKTFEPKGAVRAPSPNHKSLHNQSRKRASKIIYLFLTKMHSTHCLVCPIPCIDPRKQNPSLAPPPR